MFPNLRLLLLRFFIVVQEINYPSCFIFYYEIKKRKKRPISLFRQSHSIPGPFRANSTSVRLRGFVLCRYFREQCEKTRKHDRRKFFPVDGTVWYMDRLTNHSKPSSIGQKHSHCFANYSKSVVIGYSGRKLPWKLLTIVYKGKSLPLKVAFVLVDLPIGVHR